MQAPSFRAELLTHCTDIRSSRRAAPRKVFDGTHGGFLIMSCRDSHRSNPRHRGTMIW